MAEPAMVAATEEQDTSALSTEEIEKALSSPTEEEAPAEEGQTKEAAETTPAKADEGRKEGEPAKPPEPTEEEKLAKQKADKEAFIARQKEERDRLEAEIQENRHRIGYLRKKAAELRKEAQDSSDSVDIAEKVAFARDLDRRAQEAEAEDEIKRSRQSVKTLHPEFDSLVPEMQEIVRGHLKTLALPDSQVEGIVADFAKDPYKVPAATLANLAEAAKARMEVRTLQGELAKMREENESLKKKGDEALKKVAKAAEGASILKGTAAGTGKTARDAGTLTADQIAELSNDELDALLSAQKDNEKGG